MAKPSTDEKDDAEREEEGDEPSERDEASSEEEVVDAEIREGSEPLAKVKLSTEGGLAESTDEEDAEEEAAAQLGIQRYVLASFFAAGIVAAYVFGKAIHGIWSWAANKDWFHNTLPALAAISDDDKATYGTILGAIIAVVAVVQVYRKPAVRAWADEVASELAKVKWPTRKEVSNSTVIVIAAGALATIYLALLDRLWSFVTDLFYGTGS